MTKFVARVCQSCGKPRGTMAYRYVEGGQWTRGYFHPACFHRALATEPHQHGGSDG